MIGLNIANNTIDHDGVDLLVRSLKDNSALHALLLGGNPGFSVEAAQFAGNVTRKAPLRLSLMPKGVSMLLRRWMQLQSSEMTGGIASANTSLSGYPTRTPFEPYRQTQESSSADRLNSLSNRNNDLSDWDAESSRISLQGADKWVSSSNGIADLQYMNENDNDKKEVRSSSDVSRPQDAKNGRPHPSRGAWKYESPVDRVIHEGPERPMSAFKPRSETLSRSLRVPTNEAPSSTGHDAGRTSASKYYFNDQFNPGFYTRPKAPIGSMSVDRSRSRVQASPVQIDKASYLTKNTLDQQLRQMVSSSSGRYTYEVPQRVGAVSVSAQRSPYPSAQRSSSPSLMARRQASACTRLSQGIASSERRIPAHRARLSPQRSEYGTPSRNGRRDSDYLSSAAREGRSRSPSNRSTVYNVPPQKFYAEKTHQEEQESAVNEGSARKKKKKKKIPSQISEKDIEVKKDKEHLTAVSQATLEEVLSRFSDSVSLINRSLVTVSDQLRDVSGSLSASVLERTRTSSESGSPANRSVTTSLLHIDGTPVRSDIMSLNNGQSQIKVPLSNFSSISSRAIPEENGVDDDHPKDNLSQTFGRSRGSLMHRSSPLSNRTQIEDKDHALLSGNGISNGSSSDKGSVNSLLSSFVPQKSNIEQSSSAHSSPIRVTTNNRGSKQIHNGHTASHNASCHDRWSARILSASLPTSPGSVDASLRRGGNEFNADMNRNLTTSEDTEMSDVDMASLIRDRLRKKLKSILRPAAPSPGAKLKSLTR